MIRSLSIDFYKHRSLAENVEFFTKSGFDGVSIYISELLGDFDSADEIAEAVKRCGVPLSLHGLLCASHGDKDVSDFEGRIEKIAAWQRKHGVISILSFDVPDAIRDNIKPYIDRVLDTVEGCRVALEDFGLNETERAAIEHLKSNGRFGYLLDVGHMFIRLCGKPERDLTLFKNSPDECEACKNPSLEHFKKAFLSKGFPIFELHLHNNDGHSDQHRFLPEGKIDFAIIAKLLREIGFNGTLTLEGAPGYTFECFGNDADRGITNSLEYFTELYNKVP